MKIFTKWKKLLLVIIFMETNASIAQTADHSENPTYYLTNTWIVEKITINDSIVSFGNCIQFFHAEKKSGFFCGETNELIIDGIWTISDRQLIVKNSKEDKIYFIIKKDANFMQLEYILGNKKFELYCIWKT